MNGSENFNPYSILLLRQMVNSTVCISQANKYSSRLVPLYGTTWVGPLEKAAPDEARNRRMDLR